VEKFAVATCVMNDPELAFLFWVFAIPIIVVFVTVALSDLRC